MSGYVDEKGRNWDEGFIQALSDPNHFRLTEMQVVDYSNSPPAEAGPLGWEPLLHSKPEPEPERNRWARAWAVLRGKA
jgi:hypothetical protein